MHATYEYAARGEHARREAHLVPGGGQARALDRPGAIPKWDSGVLFVGRKGMLLADYGKHVLLPRRSSATSSRPSRSSRSRSATTPSGFTPARPATPTTVHFDYSGWLTEANHLGNVAYRAGKKLEWDAAKITRATPRKPRHSSGANTARDGH